MLFYENLENIIFTRNQLFRCDELVILSGYVGPSPIHKLDSLPLKSTVIYGMYGCDGIQKSLHNALLSENEQLKNVDIRYSSIPVHSKCYIWKNHGEVVHALIGSANFSTNGLTTPFKEVLAETTFDTFDPINKYLKMVLENSIKCEEAVVKENKRHRKNEDETDTSYDKDVCRMPLFIMDHGIPTVPAQSGVNWGMAKLSGSHVNINDAYIRIGADLIEHYPDFFPIKQRQPSGDTLVGRAGHRHNDNIEIIWDDGTTMTGLLEGSIPKMVNGVLEQYPKQISTTPKKSELGKYLRERMGIKEGKAITYADLQSYGRTSIDVSLQGEGIYFFDFSVDKSDSLGSTARSLVQSSNKFIFSTPDTDKILVAEERGKYGESRKGDK